MGFRSVPKSVTFSDLERLNGRNSHNKANCVKLTNTDISWTGRTIMIQNIKTSLVT